MTTRGPAHDHGTGHDHEHDGHSHIDHEHNDGLVGLVQGFFAPHSHDAADSVDSALESSEKGILPSTPRPMEQAARSTDAQ